jgi:hypothetical protein
VDQIETDPGAIVQDLKGVPALGADGVNVNAQFHLELLV